METKISGGLRCVSVKLCLNVSHLTLQGDGGAFPECHIAQYPLDMGRKKVRVSVYILLVPPHGFIGFFGKHTSSASGQRRQRPL